MSNHLKSAGNHLKKSSSDLKMLFFLPIVVGVIIIGICVNFYSRFPDLDNPTELSQYEAKGTLITIAIISFIGFIINIITYFSLTSNINKSGDFLILLSETLDLNDRKSDTQSNSIETNETDLDIPEVVSFENNVVRFADGVESVLFQKKITRQIMYYIEIESKKYFYEELEKGFKGSYLLKVKGIISEDGLYNRN
jgi:hypothetical protein